MSFELTQKVIRHELGLRPLEKLLLAVLADKIDNKGYCYPSIKKLCRITGMSKNSIHASIKRLWSACLIEVEVTPGTMNKYYVMEENLDKYIVENHPKKSIIQTGSPAKGHPDGSPLEGHPVDPLLGGVDGADLGGGLSLSSTQVNKAVKKKVNKSSKASLAADALGNADAVQQYTSKFIDPSIHKLSAKVIDDDGSLMVDGIKLVAGEPVHLNLDLGGEDHSAHGVYEVTSFTDPIEEIPQFANPKTGAQAEFVGHLKFCSHKLTPGMSYAIKVGSIPNSWIDLAKDYIEKIGLVWLGYTAYDDTIRVHRPEIYKSKMEPVMVSVNDVIAATKTNTLDLKKGKPTAATIWVGYVVEWRIAHLTSEPQLLLPSITIKDKKMLTTIQKKAGKEYGDIVAKCVSEWKHFVSYANSHTGTKAKPTSPSIAYFVKHYEEALLFWFTGKSIDTSIKKLVLKNANSKIKVTKAKIQQSAKTKALLKKAKEKKGGTKT